MPCSCQCFVCDCLSKLDASSHPLVPPTRLLSSLGSVWLFELLNVLMKDPSSKLCFDHCCRAVDPTIDRVDEARPSAGRAHAFLDAALAQRQLRPMTVFLRLLFNIVVAGSLILALTKQSRLLAWICLAARRHKATFYQLE